MAESAPPINGLLNIWNIPKMVTGHSERHYNSMLTKIIFVIPLISLPVTTHFPIICEQMHVYMMGEILTPRSTINEETVL